MDFILYGLICFVATTIGSISGIGGGVIIKPLLDISSPLSAGTISFLSGCTVLSMSVASLIQSRKSEIKVDGKATTALAIGAAFGGVAGKVLFSMIEAASENASLISTLQNIILALLTVFVAVYVLCKDRIRTTEIDSHVVRLMIGLALGCAGAFLGIGGGPINLVVLYFFFSMDTKTAALSSIYIIFFSQTASLLYTLAAGEVPAFDLITLLVMAGCGILGGIFGRFLSGRLSAKGTDKLFFCVLIVITGIAIANIIRFQL